MATATQDESTALTVFDPDFLPATSAASDDDFNLLAKGSEYLLSVKLYGASSTECKKGLIPIGHYGIREDKDKVIDLGDSIDVLPLAWRPKALDWSDRNSVVAVHDKGHPEFKRIADAVVGGADGVAVGPAFLVYERSTGRFLEWFCGGKSAQRAAKDVKGFMAIGTEEAERLGVKPQGPQPVTLKVKFIERKFSWHAPTVHKCSTPFTNLPPASAVQAEVEKFINPPAYQTKGEGEEASEEEAAHAARAR